MSFDPEITGTNRVAFAAAGAAALVLFISLSTATAGNRKPAFDGKSLAGWHILGPAAWRAANGEIVATMSQTGGWLVQDQSWQDLSLKFSWCSCSRTLLLSELRSRQLSSLTGRVCAGLS
jgi:hypothetical protein